LRLHLAAVARLRASWWMTVACIAPIVGLDLELQKMNDMIINLVKNVLFRKTQLKIPLLSRGLKISNS
jgi:hypothetical protein